MVRRKSMRVTDRARETFNDDDRISRLPDEVIHHIYSFTDSRFSVQSSALSRRFRNTWKTQPCIDFQINRPVGYIFPNFVHRFLSDRDDKAELATIDFRSNSIKLALLKEVIIYAISHKTRKINIEFYGEKTRRGGFDASLLRSQFLQDLRLSIDFELLKTPYLTWDLPSLTSLTLQGVTFALSPNNKSMDLFSSLPNLKTLVLVDCRLSFIDTFLITSSELMNLSLIDLNYNAEIIISAPKLASFTYYGMARFHLSTKNLDALQKVNFHTLYHKALQKQPKLVEMMVKSFKQLSNAKFLTVNSDVVRFLAEYPELLEKECPFTSLRSLTLVEQRLPPSSIVYSDVITYFRSNCPGLLVNIAMGVTPWKIRCIDCV